MLKPVVRPRENGPPLIPNDLLMMKESNPQQAVENLASENGRMPDVRNLKVPVRRQGDRLRVKYSAVVIQRADSDGCSRRGREFHESLDILLCDVPIVNSQLASRNN
jgi:hypothetical protein